LLLTILAKRPKWSSLVVLFLAVGLVLILRHQSLSNANPLVLFTGKTMGTTFSVKVVGHIDENAYASLKNDFERILTSVNAQMSTYIPESEISRFNSSDSLDWFSISRDFFVVADLADKISRDSHGAFDPTIQPLVNAWGFGPQNVPLHQPDQHQVDQLLVVVGIDKLQLRENPPAIRKLHSKVSIDFSAIAKGFAVDKLAEHLEQLGYSNFMVEIGGEIRVRGRNANQMVWKLGIEKPEVSENISTRMVQRTVEMDTGSMATSGSYRNYHELDGKRFSHTIDPRTGYPITHRLVSVTVISETCAQADGWATALTVLGPERGLEIANTRGVSAYFIVMTGEGIKELFSEQFDAQKLGTEVGVQ